MKALYLIDVSGISTEEALKIITTNNKLYTKLKDFTELLITETIQNKQQIDTLITKHAENWELGRMSTVDRNILRIGTCEMLKTPETPINVIIDEAIEIAKKFSTPEASKFVNGILDKIKEVRWSKEIVRGKNSNGTVTG
ncbi:MAG: transcription antitermination factor NusB [Elusimicrobiota bacterium]|nr:transcription antitermination factor NusB [Elusimicrobiota bacterium]